MTIRKHFEKVLYEHGLFEDQASAIMDAAAADKLLEAMQDRWNDDVSGYEKPMFGVIFLSVKRVAAKWLADNFPNHWARGMFEDGLVNG